MFCLLKGNFRRLYTNKIFLGGLLLAFVITAWFTLGKSDIAAAHNLTHSQCMLLAGGAMYGFFSIFFPYFFGVEYQDGVIKNKLIYGYPEGFVYLSCLLTGAGAVITMACFWFLGGILGGAGVCGKLLREGVAFAFSNAAYGSIIILFTVSIKKMAAASVAGIVIFHLSGTFVTAVNMLYFYGDEMGKYVMRWFMNILPMGQWFAAIGYADAFRMGTWMQLSCSGLVILFSLWLGMERLNKRDI